MKNKNNFFLAFKDWLPLAVVIIIFSGLVYGAVQQNYRTSANDPQTQLTQDVASALNDGQVPLDSVVPAPPTTEVGKSLSVFLAVYNASTTPIGSSVALDGKLPTLPAGVFEYTKKYGENRFTWEPKKGMRIAAILRAFQGPTPGFALAGRSLKEIEIREKNLSIMTASAGLLALVLSYLVYLLMRLMGEKEIKMEQSSEHNHAHHPPHPEA